MQESVLTYGDLHEEIYMQQLEGFEKEGKDSLVFELKKSLHNFKASTKGMVQ